MNAPEDESGTIERFFGVRAAGSSLRREVLGGVTTFLTMAYILAVNPVFLVAAGMPRDGAVLATAAAAALATAAMGVVANLPVALAPGMGLNAFFAYTICLGHKVPWQAGLGLLLLVSLVFLGLTAGRVRALITSAVPPVLRFSAAVGIGLFITMIGLQHAGIVAPHPATYVTLGDLGAPHARLALAGLAVTLFLAARKVRTAIFWGMIITAGLAAASGLLRLPAGAWVEAPRGRLPGLEVDIAGALDPDLLPAAVALLFFAVFDAMGTLYAVGAEAGLLDAEGRFPRLGRALAVDAGGAVAGALLGTSSVTCYIESATGVSVGARTGLASVVTAACFGISLFFLPLVLAVSAGVPAGEGAGAHTYYPLTAPALVVVGVLMARSVVRIEWGDITEAVPAFLTLSVMPATFNISHGLAAGFVSYACMKLAAGRGREAHWIVYVLAALFAWRYLALPGGH
jgi:AGZA family xanthine/uracil permease-like MFS transporter